MSYDKKLWEQVRSELQNDKTRQEEMKNKTIQCQNNQTLRFYDKFYGNAGPSGFCLFICLHGGGQGSAQMNDGQWNNIISFENGAFTNGTIAVAPRGITNTWNLHFVKESFPAITRLVENYIIFYNVDPNRIYLMGFSAGGDGTYSLSERLPFLFAACSPQAGHPNGISTINLCNLPTYLAAGEKDTSFKRNEICVEYYKKIMEQNGKFCGNYIAKVEVVAGSGHSFQCWKTPRNSFFNGSNKATQSNDTAFTFMYSYKRNPHPKGISCDVKTFLTPLRNYYTQRGNSFYNIEIGKNPSDMIQLEINYGNNTIKVKEGKNFRINLVSSLFKKGDVVIVNYEGKNQKYQLQKDQNYAKNNMKLFCDPNFGYDSYINIGNFEQEVKLAYVPQAAFAAVPQPQKPPQSAKPKLPAKKPSTQNQAAKPKPPAQKPEDQKKNPKPQPKPKTLAEKIVSQNQAAKPQTAKPKPKPQPQNQADPNQAAKQQPKPKPKPKPKPQSTGTQLPNVNKPTKNNKNPAQYLDKTKTGKPYLCVKLAETHFAWSNDNKYWMITNHPQSLMGTPIFHLKGVFYLNPSALFHDVPKGNYFLLLRHNPCNNSGLNSCTLTIKVDDKQLYSDKFFNKDYKKIQPQNILIDELVMNIKANSFNNANNHEISAEIFGEQNAKKNWDLDGFILIPDNCNGKIESIYNQYFNTLLFK